MFVLASGAKVERLKLLLHGQTYYFDRFNFSSQQSFALTQAMHLSLTDEASRY